MNAKHISGIITFASGVAGLYNTLQETAKLMSSVSNVAVINTSQL